MSEPTPVVVKRSRSNFWRACGFLRPYRRAVISSILCALATGVFTAGGLGALLPLLNVLVQGTTVHTYVDSVVVGHELHATLSESDGSYTLVRYDRKASDKSLPVGSKLSPADLEQRAAAATPPWYLAAVRGLSNRLPTHPVGAIAVIFAGFMCLSIAGNITKFFQELLSDLTAIRAINDIRRKLYDHVLHLPMSHFARYGTGDVTARLVTDAQGLQDGFKTVLGKAIQEPINAAFALGVAMFLDWRLTIFILIFAPAMLAIVKKFGTNVRRTMRAALQKNSTMLGQIDATLSGIRVVKSAAAEPFERRRYSTIMARLNDEQFRMARYEAWSGPTLEILGLLAVGGVLVVAAYFVLVERSLEAAQFMVIMFALAVIGESIRRVSKLNNVLQRSNAAAKRIFDVIDSGIEHEPLPTKQIGRDKLRFDREISFDHVEFRYDDTHGAALDDVSLAVPKGRSVAVVGRNGSGKTTLLSLLPRFYDPQAGAVRIDGVDVRDWPLRRLRRMVGVVTQEAVLFPGTIHDNIAYARPGTSRDEVIRAAKRAYADDFIMEKPLGYETPVDGLGGGLSGGQRQRINIARAILRDTPILILDEATSQVDAESEHLIQQAITSLMKDRTTFVIAHRFSTILSADLIAVLDRGRLVGVGRHDELLATCVTYKQLYERQLFTE